MNIDDVIMEKEHVETFALSVQSSAQNSQGEVIEKWTASAHTAEPCLLQALSGRQLLALQGLKIDAQYVLFADTSITTIKNRDKVVCGGKTYYVEHIKKTFSKFNTHYELYLKLEANENELSSGY